MGRDLLEKKVQSQTCRWSNGGAWSEGVCGVCTGAIGVLMDEHADAYADTSALAFVLTSRPILAKPLLAC
eukprot:1157333-Pelagomonas_calceolata.AAC.6